jgi:hypothetical protein
MPNIEIHGEYTVEEGNALLQKIFARFKGKPYVDETVVTFSRDHVVDKDGFRQPFIRLVNSYQEHTNEIIEILQTLNMDIEHLELKAFIPKKS